MRVYATSLTISYEIEELNGVISFTILINCFIHHKDACVFTDAVVVAANVAIESQ